MSGHRPVLSSDLVEFLDRSPARVVAAHAALDEFARVEFQRRQRWLGIVAPKEAAAADRLRFRWVRSAVGSPKEYRVRSLRMSAGYPPPGEGFLE